MRYFIKTVFSLLFICLLAGTAKAQIGYNYAQYDLGLGLDINKVYGDAQTIKSSKSAHFNFNYNAGPYINYILEVQTGVLQGGDSLTTTTGRQFKNNFNAVMFRAQLQMGEIFDYADKPIANAFKNLYVSSGVGFVVNHITNINRESILTPGFYTPGELNSNEIVIPARIGYEFKVFNSYDQPAFKIDLGYQYNFVLGDSLDGFTAGTQKDHYSQYSIGIKFAVGGITSYRKQIPY